MGEVLARLALLAYPRAFRRTFGADMMHALRDRVDEASVGGVVPALLSWTRSLADLVGAGLRERLRPSCPPRADHDRAAAATRRPEPGTLMDHLRQDLRFAVRSLRRRPGFATVAIVTLALGIGATTAVFSVVQNVLLSPLPYPEADRLVMVWNSDTDGAPTRGYMSQPDIESVRGLPGLTGLEGVTSGGFTLTGVEHPERVQAARVTGGILSIMGAAPALGRDLREDENDPNAPRVVVVGYDFWKSRLGGRPDVIGSTLELTERSYEIVGVAPEGFDFPDGVQLWTPNRLDLDGCGRGCHVYRGAVGRLADGTTVERAQETLTALSSALGDEFPDSNFGQAMRFETLLDSAVADASSGIWIVLGAVVFVLLIVAANVANLLLVRASTRTGEVAVRSALGASRGRLVAQVLTESLVLACLGGALGVALAHGLLDALKGAAPAAIPRLDEVALDGPVLLFAVALTGIVSLVFGLSPALHLSRRSVAGEISATRRSGRREGRGRSWLLASEVALSLTLLAGAGLLLRSLGRLYSVDMGFDGGHVARFSVNLPSSRYDSLPKIVSFYEQLEQRLAALPGVVSVGSAWSPPLGSSNATGDVLVEGRPEPEPGQETYAAVRPVTPGYFGTMGLTLLRGRGIEATDRRDTEPVAVVNEAFARESFPGEDVLGKRIRVTVGLGYGSPYWTVVGVVHDVRRILTAEPEPALYMPQAQYGPGSMTVHIRTAGVAGGVLTAARAELASLDPNLVAVNVTTMRDAIRADAAPTRFYLFLVGLFAALAVVLAAIGLYGVVAYLVSRRTREIGVRIALGARRPEIAGLVFREAAVPTALGVVVGLAATLAGARVMRGLLFQVSPTDPLVLVGVTGLIVTVSALAVLVPARRATRVDPVGALRAE